MAVATVPTRQEDLSEHWDNTRRGGGGVLGSLIRPLGAPRYPGTVPPP